ncbi:Hsp20/alpha crystallin family protein [Nocardia pseudobrasiliensis]|uniref:HSP20 family molecular chaperone IbpA n=1 Tax=Nocardia pseudobrasiliensis TaxID=45979 RepID=A0A370HPR6_9NOCA|nr:Hsp20/alpha crystallin family protein [Nocardia pseudobrasiliensis]RDI60457.1 HSP20 family molecular chaperone IbpA [Nocardia pseudobrasiliensis]
MSPLSVRRQPGSWLADLWSSFTQMSVRSTHPLRVEDLIDDGHYVVRAELPGVDPDEDVEVSVHDRKLTIKAERIEAPEEKRRSEFGYGSYARTMTLPEGTQEENIDATYAKGILTVTMPVVEPKQVGKKVPVKSGD